MTSVDGERVKVLRESRLLERQELADLAGVSYSTIYKMEHHGHLPRFGTVRAVAKALKVKPDEIGVHPFHRTAPLVNFSGDRM